MLSTNIGAQHTAQLKGIVEVTRPLRDTNTSERIRIAHLCKDAILNLQGSWRESYSSMERVTGEVIFRGHQDVHVVIDGSHFKVFQKDTLVTKQLIQDISTIIAIRESNGVLVIMGQCQKNKKRIAIVLLLSSDQDADLVINDYTQAMDSRNKRMSMSAIDIMNSSNTTNQRVWTPFADLPSTNSSRSNTPVGIVRPLVPVSSPQNEAGLPAVPTPKERMETNPVINSERPLIPQRPAPHKPTVQVFAVPSGVNTTRQKSPGLTSPSTPIRPVYKAICAALALGSTAGSRDLPPPPPPAYLKPTISSPCPSEESDTVAPPRPPNFLKPVKPIQDKKPMLPPRRPRGLMLSMMNNLHQNTSSEVQVSPGSAASFKTLRHSLPEINGPANDPTDAETFNDQPEDITSCPKSFPLQYSASLIPTEQHHVKDIVNRLQASNSSQPSINSPEDKCEISNQLVSNSSTKCSEDDGSPCMMNNKNRWSLSSSQSRLSTSSESSWNNESEYPCQETLYASLGISVEDSERMYMNKPMRPLPKDPKSSESMSEQITGFLLEDRKYIDKLQQIIKSYEDMPPQLQTHLRRLQPLCQVHQDIHNEITNCSDSCSEISEVLIEYREKLEPYIYYIMKATEINNILQDLPQSLLDSYPYIKDEIRSTWKKFNFYLLNLEMFLKYAPAEDKPSVTKAIDMMRDLNRRADTEILLDGVKGAPYPLHTLGSLLLHNPFQLSGPHLKKGYDLRVLLFPTTIVITECKHDRYDFFLGLPIRQSCFGPVKQENTSSFVIEVNYGKIEGKRCYTFQARTKQVKEAWVIEISRLLHQFAEEEKQVQNKRTG